MPFVIPIFIPHEGCPHCCIFCNQHRISGHLGASVTASDVGTTITTWLGRSRKNPAAEVQVAFYGGSFTGLPLSRQEELLAAVAPFVAQGQVQTIRLSTRPDYIDPQRVDFLLNHNVSIVELGVQSLDDEVLAASNRGHNSEQANHAIHLLREAGLRVGVQLMLGLPGDTTLRQMRTTEQVIALQPEFVRIYPVLVIRGSLLETRYNNTMYTPLSLDCAVIRAARMKKRFDECGIKVVRMGLQPSTELERALVAGPYHPAFGEMVNSRLMLQQTRKLLAESNNNRQVVLTISDRDQSVFRGIKLSNIRKLEQLGLAGKFILRLDCSQPRLTVKLRVRSKINS
ncbi:MAG: radical SAM protein [Desulfobulbaceae bacterium]|nr:radical SAM protein [Desulfobulbaceae bacterium]